MKQTLLLLIILVVYGALPAQNPVPAGMEFTPVPRGISADSVTRIAAHVKPSSRQIAWQETEFSIFIHFGMNTFTGREWGTGREDPELFNPTAIDVHQWAAIAAMAGAKQIIMVAKHHDGFCLWPSKFTDHSVQQSHWRNGKGNLVAEVAIACRDYGLRFGIYLSPWDLHSPVYGTPQYNEYFMNQLRELLSGYGPVSEVWFDGACGEGPNGKRQVYDWPGYYQVVRELQPDAVIAITGPDVRWVGTESGYGNETEWSVIRADSGFAWYPPEVDVSIRPGWFYHEAEDSLVKSPEKLIDIYFSSVGRNSLLLLNLPPDTRGLISGHDRSSLEGMSTLLDATFRMNLAAEAELSGDGPYAKDLPNLVDDNDQTFWTPGPGITSPTVSLDLSHPVTFDCLMLQENIRNGQRVEGFVLEAKEAGHWKEAARGTTIGYKRLLRFPPVTAREIRIRILSSRDVPELSSFGLYKTP